MASSPRISGSTFLLDTGVKKTERMWALDVFRRHYDNVQEAIWEMMIVYATRIEAQERKDRSKGHSDSCDCVDCFDLD